MALSLDLHFHLFFAEGVERNRNPYLAVSGREKSATYSSRLRCSRLVSESSK